MRSELGQNARSPGRGLVATGASMHNVRMAESGVLRRLGVLIAREREARKWNQDELAAAASVSRKTVSRVENGTAVRRTKLTAIVEDGLKWPTGRLEQVETELAQLDDPGPVEMTEVAHFTDAEFDSFILRSLELLPAMRRHLGHEYTDAYIERLVEAARQRGRDVSALLRNAR